MKENKENNVLKNNLKRIPDKDRIVSAVGKVVLNGVVTKTGKNYFWIRITRHDIKALARYWRNNKAFYYMKIYKYYKFKQNGVLVREVGDQIGFITQRVETLNIDTHLLWKRKFNPESKKWEY